MYGENSGHLRDAMGALLREHRIQQRLGGKGTHTVPETTTVAEREELGRQIRRYRVCVLTWSLQAVRSANPRADLGGTTVRSRGPAEELRFRLTEALTASSAYLASSEELTTEQQFATVEAWRQAARSAVLGEHDFPAGVRYSDLTDQQCMTVLKDVADVVRGLVALDRRYSNVPGWEKLHNQGWLGRAAETCAAHAGYDEPDYAVDRQGWHQKPEPMDGPAMPGLTGVMQAQYNLLLNLDEIPDAHSLRVVMESQRIVTHEATLRVAKADSDLTSRWTVRKTTYTKLVQETRDLGGVLGRNHAAGSGALAATRAQKLARAPLTDASQLRQLDRLFDRIDERVYAAVEHGVRERLYFLRVPIARIDDHAPGPVKGQRQRYAPITSPAQTDLIAIVRNELRPGPIRLSPPDGAARSRADFEAAINHRAGDDPGPSLAL
jgi:hypothetical protein